MCLIAILEPFTQLLSDTFADELAIHRVTDISADKPSKPSGSKPSGSKPSGSKPSGSKRSGSKRWHSGLCGVHVQEADRQPGRPRCRTAAVPAGERAAGHDHRAGRAGPGARRGHRLRRRLPARRRAARSPLIAWSPYGKHAGPQLPDRYPDGGVGPGQLSGYTAFESPNPVYWTARGYAVVNADMPGTWYSGGDATFLSPEEALRGHDLIEWAGTQSWSNGRVGMSGVSYLTSSMWTIAATRPPHLAARGEPRCSAWPGRPPRHLHGVCKPPARRWRGLGLGTADGIVGSVTWRALVSGMLSF